MTDSLWSRTAAVFADDGPLARADPHYRPRPPQLALAQAVCQALEARQALVAEAHAAVVPLIGGPLAGFADPSPADLSPRARQVLRCLLEGDSDKEAAARLGISRFTVNEHTKEIYRHFGAQGRAELLALWVRRRWSNGFAW